MFLGTYKITFSGLNRLILPKKLRKELGNVNLCYLVLGENGEIWGFNKDGFDRLSSQILDISLFSSEGWKKRLKFFSRAEECILDFQGRFIIPPHFSFKTENKKEILIIGAGDHFEIWNPKRWAKIDKFTNDQ